MTKAESEKLVRKVITKEWWDANNSFLCEMYEKIDRDLGTERMSIFHKGPDIYYEIFNSKDTKNRGITREEVCIWDAIRRFYSTRIQVTV